MSWKTVNLRWRNSWAPEDMGAYAATDRLTSRKVAIKVESRGEPKAKGQLENDAHILNYLSGSEMSR